MYDLEYSTTNISVPVKILLLAEIEGIQNMKTVIKSGKTFDK